MLPPDLLDVDDFPDVELEPEVDFPVVAFDVLDFAFVDDALEAAPDVLLVSLESDDESEPEAEEDDVGLLLLLPIDELDEDDGVLDDPLDIFDDWFELWFFSVSFIVVISLFIIKN